MFTSVFCHVKRLMFGVWHRLHQALDWTGAFCAGVKIHQSAVFGSTLKRDGDVLTFWPTRWTNIYCVHWRCGFGQCWSLRALLHTAQHCRVWKEETSIMQTKRSSEIRQDVVQLLTFWPTETSSSDWTGEIRKSDQSVCSTAGEADQQQQLRMKQKLLPPSTD